MNVEIAQRLASRRKQAGLSQETLAERLGVSRQAVSKWERSESSPDTDNLIALAQLYGVSLDDLLYVDDEMRDDVVFEAADRASARAEETGGADGAAAAAAAMRGGDAQVAADATTTAAGADSAGSAVKSEGDKKVHLGFGGIHVLDGDDYVHVSWRDGVHVKDGKKGDEVHVGWNGVHVKEAPRAEGADAVGDAGFAKTSDGEWFGATSDGFGGRDDEGNEVIVDGDGVIINGEHFESWRDAHERYGFVHGHDHNCGKLTFEKTWNRFPFPLVALVAYLLLGIFGGWWGLGLFLVFTIPLYYMVGRAIASKRIASLLTGAYPLLVTAWFCYRAFVLNQPHPAWVAFLTIPVVEWLLWALSRWWRGRKRSKAVVQDAPIDMEAQS